MKNLKNFGQHFLIDQKVVAEFLRACALSGSEQVLEIGSGEGALTVGLCQQARQVTALEIDFELKPKLLELQHRYNNLQIIFINALKYTEFKYDLICGALSFAIFEPLLIRLIRYQGYKRLVFLVSHRVKQDYQQQTGLVYYLLNSFFQVKFGQKILPQAFAPKPRTAGVIISLTPVLPVDKRFLLWRRKFLTDNTIWQKTRAGLEAINQQILYT